ncbi:regulatory protein GemA [Elioraea sp.]|uniref:regulatory protein GemA n=1 Tax=Elioraea sp. TaxID=2185103 RepID=UPI0025B966B1|nr:regulatory protein GemA [Elioraea sp.]
MSIPARLAGAIHACRKRVAGLDDDVAWRGFLEATTGKASLRAMDGRELGRVLDALHKRGAPRTPGKGAGQRSLPSDPLSKKIRALWLALADAGAIENPSEQSLDAFVKRQTGIDSLRWADGPAKVRVVEALKGWARRVGAVVFD